MRDRMRYLVTGTAGFIGFHVARRLLLDGHQVTGIDGLTPYYDVKLKERRHALLQAMPGFTAHHCMLEEFGEVRRIIRDFVPDRVIHLAAQAGVRYSIENPRAYIDANIIGSFNLLEICREFKPAHLMMASTSSIYGGNPSLPFSENQRTDYPLTLYAATKKSVEVIAHNYSHLWNLSITAFRFFTVYGPWGRPDMALFKFVQNILKGEPIDVYNHGKMIRDFTYIDDLVEAIIRLCEVVPGRAAAVSDADSLSPVAPFRVVNIGGGSPVKLLTFIEEIEAALGRPAIRNYMDMQPGDVPETEASTLLLEQLIGYRPQTPVREGVRQFVRWYLDYHAVQS